MDRHPIRMKDRFLAGAIFSAAPAIIILSLPEIGVRSIVRKGSIFIIRIRA